MGYLWIFIYLGFLLSLYALYVEHKASHEEGFEAFCDISDEISCSKVFLSEYGKIFSFLGVVPKDSILDQPNALYGLGFYFIFGATYGLLRDKEMSKVMMLGLSAASMVLSAYLSYILTDVLQDKCVVCFGTYVCNFALFIGSTYNSREKTATKK